VEWTDADTTNETVQQRIRRAETRMLEALRELELVMENFDNIESE